MNKRALIIGINRYGKYPGHDLQHAVADAHAWFDVLHGKFGFPRENMERLCDDEAGKVGILEALDRLGQATEEGDVVAVVYCGHGTRLSARTREEPDGFDEAIAPSDWNGKEDPEGLILDDELGRRLHPIHRKTSGLTLIFDCCASGSLLRDTSDERIRFAPPAPNSAPTVAPPRHPRGERRWAWDPSRYVFLAACHDGEFAIEKDRIGHGAFTEHLLRELRAAGPETSMLEVFRRASVKLTKDHQGQHPCAEGALGREIFGVRDLAPPEAAAVAYTFGCVLLNVGQFHGVQRGEVWSVRHPERMDGEVAKVEVKQVFGATAKSEVVPGTGYAGDVHVGNPVVRVAGEAWDGASRFRQLAGADGPGRLPTGAVTVTVSLHDGSTWIAADPDRGISIDVHQPVALDLKNDAGIPLFMALLFVNARGKVFIDETIKGSTQIVPPGGVVSKGRDDLSLTFDLPEGAPASQPVDELILVLASTKRTDYGALTVMRDAAPTSIPGSLFRDALHAVRGAPPPPLDPSASEQWCVVAVPFRLQPEGRRS